MTEDEIIAVVTAYKEGKTVQRRRRMRNGSWLDGKHLWNFADNEYRIKPEPMEFWVSYAGGIGTYVASAQKPDDLHDWVHVREVLDES